MTGGLLLVVRLTVHRICMCSTAMHCAYDIGSYQDTVDLLYTVQEYRYVPRYHSSVRQIELETGEEERGEDVPAASAQQPPRPAAPGRAVLPAPQPERHA